VDNGNMMDTIHFRRTQRKLYDGNAIALLRATGTAWRDQGHGRRRMGSTGDLLLTAAHERKIYLAKTP